MNTTYSVIFVPKIIGIGSQMLKLSLVVDGWYTFLRHSVHPFQDNLGKPTPER